MSHRPMRHQPMRRDTLRIAEEAAEWMDALSSGDESGRAAFVQWLSASPRHLEEFLLLTASEQAWQNIDADRTIDVEALIAELNPDVLPLPHPESPATATFRHHPLQQRRTWYRAAAVAAAAIALAATMVWMRSEPDSYVRYTTAIGEQRAVELEDGSLVHLNTRTSLEVRLTDRRREVHLLEGEALFKVAQDQVRPFQVSSGSTVIRVIGTQFNVSRAEQDTTVSVIEGRVQVSRSGALPRTKAAAPGGATPRLLSAGEQARIVDDGQITRASVDPAEVGTWRQRRLVFRDSTLGEIAAEFNRYNRMPQILIEDESVRARRYGGTFDADDPQALITFLRPEEGLICESRGSTLVIRPRR